MSSETKLLTVSEAVAQRRACRDFLPKEVSIKLVKQILNEARTAPSNGNTQPSKVYLVHGETRNKLCQIVRKKINSGVIIDLPSEFSVYPGMPLPLPQYLKIFAKHYPKYYKRYQSMGAQIYKAQGVPRGDLKLRMETAFRAYDFFGAPIGIFLTIDKGMEVAQYHDLGVMLQTIMLLCEQYGLSTCGLVVWSMQYKIVKQLLNIPKNEIIFCGLAIGYENKKAPVNNTIQLRKPFDEFVVIPKLNENYKLESHSLFKLRMGKELAKFYMKEYLSYIFMVVVAGGVGVTFLRSKL
eukprot:60914_1